MSEFRTGAIFKGALMGGVAAGVLDMGIFLAGKAAGAKFLIAQHGTTMPIPSFQPMLNCVMGAIVAAGIFAGLVKLAGNGAWKIFLGVAAVVFALFFALPIVMLPGDTMSIALLEIMHIPAAFGIMDGIRRSATR